MSAESNGNKLGIIEAGRGLAATAVVIYHASRHLDKVYGRHFFLTTLFHFTHAGVDIFFVISGFIILFVHYKDIGRPERLSHYIGRRFTRVFPTYWVALALTILLALGSRGLPGFSAIAMSASLLPSHHEPILGIAWTLQHEVVFYTVFALLILNRGIGRGALAIWFGIVCLSTIFVWKHLIPPPLVGAFNLEFFIGMAVAWWVRDRAVPRPLTFLAAGCLLFAVAAGLEVVGMLDGYSSIARLAYGLPAGLIVLGAAGASSENQVRVPSVLRHLGAASYSIYLFQFVFIGFAWKLLGLASGTGASGAAWQFVLLVAGAVAGGIAASRLVEYPLIRAVRGITFGQRLRPA